MSWRNKLKMRADMVRVTAIVLGLCLTSQYSYLLFHSLAETFGVMVGFSIFAIAWNTRRFLPNHYLKVVGIGYLLCAFIDLLHVLAFQETTLFPGHGAQLTVQLWIAARYLQAATLFAATFFISRRIEDRVLLPTFIAVASVILMLVFSGNFPDCYIKGTGLTPFKIASEYLIAGVLLVSLWLLHRQRARFELAVYAFIAVSLVLTAASEIVFSLWLSMNDYAHMAGHLLKVAAYYLMYRALVVTGLDAPLDLIFRDLKQAEKALRQSRDTLEESVARRTAELRASNERLKLRDYALDHVHEAAYLIDENARLIYVNEESCRAHGYSRDELLTMTVKDIDPGMTAEAWLQHWRELHEKGSLAIETTHRRKDGSVFPIEVNASYFEYDGKPYNLALVRDITARQDAERRLQASEQAFRTLAENSPDNIVRYDTECRMVYVNPQLEATRFMAADEMLGRMPLQVHPDPDTTAQVMAYMACIESVIATGKDSEHEAVLPDAGEGRRYHHIRLVAERNEAGDIIGALAIGRDITGIRRAERDLQLLNRAMNQSYDAAYLLDFDLRLRYVNDAAMRVLGYSREELLSMELLAIDPLTVPEAVRELMRQTAAAGSFPGTIETQHRAKDGRLIPVEIGASAIEFDGETLYLTVARDITERKRMETVLAAREQEFRSLAESSPDSIIRYDREHRILYLNGGLIHDLGLASADEVIGKRPIEVWPDGRFAEIDKAAASAIETGNATSIELVRTDTPKLRYGHISVVPERDADGQIIGTIAFGRDVTAIREAECRLRHFIDSLPGFAFSFRFSSEWHGSFPYASPAITEFYGLDPADVKDDMAPLHNLAHPDDRPRIEAALAESARALTPLHIEFRICPPGLPERWLDVRSVPEREADGGVLWYGLMLDISKRMDAERRLRESYDLLQELASRRETAREEERKRIAREIHDELGQHLTAVRMGVASLHFLLEPANPALAARAEKLTALIDKSFQVVRAVVTELRPPILEAGLAAALEWLAAEFERNNAIACRLHVPEGNLVIGENRAIALVRIVQESLTNVARHAKANQVTITLIRDGGDYLLEVHDDGQGFDPTAARKKSFGLLGIRERVFMLGGKLDIAGAPGKGAAIKIRIPIDEVLEKT